MRTTSYFLLLLAFAFLAGCRPGGTGLTAGQPETSELSPAGSALSITSAPTRPLATTPTATASRAAPPHTPTPLPTSTPSPMPTATATPLPTPSPTPLSACSERHPSDETILTLVTRDYGLSRDYKPGDLVPLSDTFPNSVTLGYPTEVRQVIIPALEEMVAAMQAEDLRPLIVSGFRDYYAQSLAEQKWVEQYPDWAHNLSAPPGHSEHQLGTTLDFSSPALPEMVGEEHIQFHPAFAQSEEGKWLAAHAHEYGFTMSYPADHFEDTAFYYEPWHFRYVGVELSTHLFEEGLTISEYLLETTEPPCIP